MSAQRTVQSVYAVSFGLVAAATAHTYGYAVPVLLILAACGVVLLRRVRLRSVGAFIPGVMLMMPVGGSSLLLRVLGVAGVLLMFELEAVLLRQGPESGWATLKPVGMHLGAIALSSALAYGLYTAGFVLPTWSAVVALISLSVLFLRLGSDRSDTQ